jgi:hypothetical protein
MQAATSYIKSSIVEFHSSSPCVRPKTIWSSKTHRVLSCCEFALSIRQSLSEVQRQTVNRWRQAQRLSMSLHVTKIAGGATAVVYAARDNDTEQMVALKVWLLHKVAE